MRYRLLHNNKFYISKSIGTLLIIPVIIILFAPDFAKSQQFRGEILEEVSRETIPHAVIFLLDESEEQIAHVSADADGYYEIDAPVAGTYYILARRIGFTEIMGGPFEIEEGQVMGVTLRLLEIATLMDELTVVAERYNEMLIDEYLEQNRFFARQKRGLGRFITRDDLKEMRIFRTSELFVNTQGVTVDQGILYSSRYNCPMRILINGFEVASSPTLTLEEFDDIPPTFSIDTIVNPERIVGIEIHSGIVSEPPEFGPRTKCGTVAIWTR